jgi:hypothetical protein
MAEIVQPAGTVVSFAQDIVPLFRPMDIQCMRGRDVFLIDYQYMSTPGNAAMVIEYLTGASTPRMPYGGPYWSADSVQLLQSWIDGGYKP